MAKNTSNIELLMDFKENCKALKELQAEDPLNIFEILKVSRKELQHSNMLAWLFNAEINGKAAEKFLELVISTVQEINNIDFKSFIIKREYKNIDLLLVSETEKVVVVIENKIGSTEHDKQLDRYYAIVEKEYEAYTKIYIYLTPDGEPPSRDGEPPSPDAWHALSYESISEILKSVIEEIDKSDYKRLFLVQSYLETIRRKVMNKDEMRLCEKIYEEYKDAIELIIEYRSNIAYQCAAIARNILDEYNKDGKIVFDSSDNSVNFQIFHTPAMNEYLEALEEPKSSWGNYHTYAYWFHFKDGKIDCKFELGGQNLTDSLKQKHKRLIEAVPGKNKNVLQTYIRLFGEEKYALPQNIEKLDDETKKEIECYIRQSLERMLEHEKELIDKAKALS